MLDFHADRTFIDTLTEIKENGFDVQSRNMKVRKIHGRMTRYGLYQNRLPLLMSKKVVADSVFKELFWFNRGDTNIKTLGCGIWDKWADEDGELGPVYGAQLRNQVFYKLAFSEKEYQTYLEAGYKDFGVAELRAEEIIEEIGEERFQKLLDAQDIVGHEVCAVGEPPYLEYSIQMMRKKVDQLIRAEQLLKKVVETGICDRRIVISLWNNADLEMQALPPCHTLYHFLPRELSHAERLSEYTAQFYYDNLDEYEEAIVERGEVPAVALYDMAMSQLHNAMAEYDPESNRVERELTEEEALDALGVPRFQLDLILYQRSNDQEGGVPFNIASYSLYAMIMARRTGMAVGEFIHFQGDVHIYEDQMEAVEKHIEQFKEMVQEKGFGTYPRVKFLREPDRIDGYTLDDIEIIGYKHKPYIPVPIAE